MPKYKYRFCDGSVIEVEVTDEQYALLKAMDKQERNNNRRHKRRTVPLRCYVRAEEKADRERDSDFMGANE